MSIFHGNNDYHRETTTTTITTTAVIQPTVEVAATPEVGLAVGVTVDSRFRRVNSKVSFLLQIEMTWHDVSNCYKIGVPTSSALASRSSLSLVADGVPLFFVEQPQQQQPQGRRRRRRRVSTVNKQKGITQQGCFGIDTQFYHDE